MAQVLELPVSDKRIQLEKRLVLRLKPAISHSKRALDIFFSVIFLLFLSPFFLLIAVAVKLTSKGPMIFRQRRVGLRGESFIMYKFRTIDHNLRASRLGKFLRKTYIDELPQLWNVIRGNMSLVGPRPHILEQVEMYQPWQYQRLSAKPGMAGLRQIRCIEDNFNFNEGIELDLEYIDNWSAWFDLKIAIKTSITLIEKVWKDKSFSFSIDN